MGSIGPTELLILLVVVVAILLVVIRGRVAANRNRETGRGQPARAISAAPASPPVVDATAPPGSIEARLLELDSLRSRGVIDADEYASARIRALEGRAGS